jgi:hypothetical protein
MKNLNKIITHFSVIEYDLVNVVRMWVSFLFFSSLFLSIAILTVQLVPRDFTKRIISDHPNALQAAW